MVVPVRGTGICGDRDHQRQVVCGIFLGGLAAGHRRWRSSASRHRQERLVSVAQLHSGDWLGHLAVLGRARRARAESVLIRFILLFLLACSAHAKTLTGYVVEITDGDTIVVLDADHHQHKIRLAGIDAPERHQPFGTRSTESIARLTFNQNVTVVWKKEHQGRPIGKVTVNGVDASLEQVKAGMAWWYRKYAKEQSPADQRLYEQAEQQARAKRAGLWADANPVPPWDFRHGTGNAAPESKATSGEQCPCGTGAVCTGPKGGRFCTTASGGKKYLYLPLNL